MIFLFTGSIVLPRQRCRSPCFAQRGVRSARLGFQDGHLGGLGTMGPDAGSQVPMLLFCMGFSLSMD